MLTQSLAEPASPCIKLCVLDPEGRACLGCRRTVAEIAGWSRMDDTHRRMVLARLAASQATQQRPGWE